MAADCCVYILGNDPYFDWVRVFLESFREHNPSVPLLFLPFDNNTRRVERLASRYRLEVVRDSYLEELDALGREFIGPGAGHHSIRRLWTFTGPYRHFLFIDTDMVVTANYDAAFAAFAASAYDLVYFDADINQVYQPGAFRDQMVEEFGSAGFNGGNWFARTGVFSRADWPRLADLARQDRQGFVLNRLEQPLINYFCDQQRLRMAHLRAIAPDASTANWAAQPVRFDPVDGSYRFEERLLDGQPARAYSLHFAGINRLGYRMPNKELYLKYRTRGLPTLERWAVTAGFRARTSRLRYQFQLARSYYWPRLKQRVRGLFGLPPPGALGGPH
jgi:hypothetical protein